MFRFLTVILLFSISLFALSDSAILKRADTLVKHKSKSDQFRAYNDYKNLYLHAIISEDKDLKIHSLEGIVKSGNKLHIDISHYHNELLKIHPLKPPVVILHHFTLHFFIKTNLPISSLAIGFEKIVGFL